MFSSARDRTHQSGSSRSFIQTGTARASSRRRESSFAGRASAGSGDPVSFRSAGTKPGFPCTTVSSARSRIQTNVPSKAWRNRGARMSAGIRATSASAPLRTCSWPSARSERISFVWSPFAVGKEALERSERRVDDAPGAPRAGQLEEVRDERLVRRVLEDGEGLDPRLLVLVLQRGDGEVPGRGRGGDLLRLGDRLQGARPQLRVPSGEGLPVDREGPLGGEVVRHLESGQLREVVAALGELHEEPAEVGPARQLPEEPLDAPAGGLRAGPRHRDDGVEDGLSTPRRFRIARPAARISGVGSAAVQATSSISRFGSAWNFSTRSFFCASPAHWWAFSCATIPGSARNPFFIISRTTVGPPFGEC